jgi:cysteine desulfurase
MQMIYLDYNSTTALAPEVLKKMNEIYVLPLNASATHAYGRKGGQLIEIARKEVKNLVNGANYEVIFTGSSTEATNTVFYGVDVETILFAKFEHSSVYNSRPKGVNIIEVEVLENGLIDIADLEKKLNSLPNNKFLMSLMLANNESGAIQPVVEVSKMVHQKGGLMHCDIVQAAGKIPVDLEALNVDFAVISAHKIKGPQGVGALFMRKGLDVNPLIHGGKQEKSKRAGTSNVAGISGFGEACKLARENLEKYEAVKVLRDYIEEKLEKIGGDKVMIFAKSVARLPNTSFVALKNTDSQTQLIHFDLNGICVSAGAACTSGTVSGSRVLKAMNVSPNFATSAIRISLSPDNTGAEVEQFIKVWDEFYHNASK